MEADSGPIVVGGVGGSGTRLIAEMLQRLGIFLGSDLNSANDNLWFTLLFRRPRWLEQAERSAGAPEVRRAITWFEAAMRGRLRTDNDLDVFLDDAVDEIVSQGLDRAFVEERRRNFVNWGTSGPHGNGSWGWKEPNSHIYLDYLSEQFGERIRYVHVIRDGIELVRRANHRQLQNWGRRFGVPVDPKSLPTDPLRLRSMILDYWIAANRRTLEVGPRLFGSRFLLLSLNRMRRDPVRDVIRLLEHLDVEASSELVSTLARLTSPPSRIPDPSDYEGLTDEQRRGFSELGFDIP